MRQPWPIKGCGPMLVVTHATSVIPRLRAHRLDWNGSSAGHAEPPHTAPQSCFAGLPRLPPAHRSTCGLVAMASASHAEGRQFDPGQVYPKGGQAHTESLAATSKVLGATAITECGPRRPVDLVGAPKACLAHHSRTLGQAVIRSRGGGGSHTNSPSAPMHHNRCGKVHVEAPVV